MIEIKISDPYNTPAAQLRAVAALLVQIAGDDVLGEHLSQSAARAHTHGVAFDGRPVKVTQIAADDSPAAGVDASEVFAGNANPQDVFGTNADPRQVFGGNAAAGATSGTPAISTPQPESIPVAPPSDAPASVANVELDSDGLPWDARIHAETKSKVKAGTWKRKRGVDDAVVAEVEAQLRAVLGVPTPNVPAATVAASPVAQDQASPTATVPAPPVAAELGNVPLPPASTPPAATLTQPTEVSPAATVPPPPPGAAAVTFPQLCARITNALNGGQLTQARLGEVLAAHKLTGLPTLAAFPQLVGPVAADLGFA